MIWIMDLEMFKPWVWGWVRGPRIRRYWTQMPPKNSEPIYVIFWGLWMTGPDVLINTLFWSAIFIWYYIILFVLWWYMMQYVICIKGPWDEGSWSSKPISPDFMWNQNTSNFSAWVMKHLVRGFCSGFEYSLQKISALSGRLILFVSMHIPSQVELKKNNCSADKSLISRFHQNSGRTNLGSLNLCRPQVFVTWICIPVS